MNVAVQLSISKMVAIRQSLKNTALAAIPIDCGVVGHIDFAARVAPSVSEIVLVARVQRLRIRKAKRLRIRSRRNRSGTRNYRTPHRRRRRPISPPRTARNRRAARSRRRRIRTAVRRI